jgi:small subunit ribosomal protein S4
LLSNKGIIMTKRIQAKYKISRRLGVNLWGRGKDPQEKKNYVPGQHGPNGRRRMPSDYGTQLFAKQKLKGYYGNITEKQFRRTFDEAANMKGDTSENLLGLLERRLDIAVYRLNFVPTVFSARQLVGHKHVLVNGKSVNIPSYRLKEGDVIEVREKSQNIPMVLETQQNPERDIPEYYNASGLKGTYVRVPTSEEIPYPVTMEPSLVVEFYSR